MPETKYIAVIDDHVMVRKGLCSLINLFEPYKVLFDADNGKDMIQKIDPNQLPDIALLDINMPEMDGFASARWLKTNYPAIKILALSTMDKDTVIIRMIQHGARGYILKDADPSELKQAFDNVLKSGYHYNEAITHKLVTSLHNNFSQDLLDTPNLTPREQEFLQFACSEKTYQEIAKLMLVSERTIEDYRDSLFRKLQVSSRVGLVICAIRKNLATL